MNHEAFQTATFGILLQFNGNMLVNMNPYMNFTNITTDYKPSGFQNTTEYVPGLMGQAVYLRGQEYINLHGIPAGFWSDDEWSVMGLMKFHDATISASKELAVLGDGEATTDKGFHLGLRNKQVLYGFYNSDILGTASLDYNKWYHVTWTWKKSNTMRKIFIDGKLDKNDNSIKDAYQGISGKTQIGTWWNGNNGHTKTDVEIDTLYIINKAIDYNSDQQLCLAKAFNSQMP